MGAWLGRKIARFVLPLILLHAPRATAQSAWEEQAVVGPIDKKASYDVIGDRLVIGEPGTGVPGVVRTFVRSGRTWSLEQTLAAPADLECFGATVALSGTTLVVGAPCAPPDGSVFVYTRPANAWEPQQEITQDVVIFGGLGTRIALDGNTLLLLSSSPLVQAFIFTRSASTWSLQQELVQTSPVTGDAFGWSGIALDGDHAVVGAMYRQVGNQQVGGGQGVAYVFARSGSTWTQAAELTSPTGAGGNQWGQSVAVLGTTLLLGGHNASPSGRVEAWSGSGSSWSYSSVLPTTDVSQVGTHLDMTSDRVATTGQGGPVQIFTRSADTFTFEQSLPTPSAKFCNDCLGTRLALAADVLAVKDLTEPSNLRIYAFGPPNGSDCSADSQCVSGHCVDGVCCNAPCDSACDECLASRGASEQGTCTIVQGSPGYPSCAPLACAGGLICEPCTGDLDCPMDRYCTSASECAPRKPVESDCDLGDCKVAGCRECASNLCVDQKCELCQADADCAAAEYCSASGGCLPTKPQGTACDLAAEADCEVAGCRACGEFSCADGVCCDTPCSGTCEACSEALSSAADGTCAPIAAGTDPENECEPDSGYPESCKADGMCDGERECRALAVAGIACGEPSCSGDSLNLALCNNAGGCVGEQMACMPYACGSNACFTTCTDDAACAFGHWCIAGVCVEKGAAVCSNDGSTSTSEDVVTECREYLCDVATGNCRTECQVSEDCASGHICDTATGACLIVEMAAEEDAGCGCRMTSRAPGRIWPALLLLLGLLRTRASSGRSSDPRPWLRRAAHRRARTTTPTPRRSSADVQRRPG